MRDYLRARGQGWIEDPGNADERFGRSRARAALAAAEDGLAIPTRSPLRFDHPPHEGQGEAGAFVWAGVLDISRYGSASTLAAALLCAGGGAVPPRGERMAALKARLAAGEDFVAGLSGARVEATGGSVRIIREPGEMRRCPPEAVRLTPGAAAVWDGRFEITATEPGWRVEAAAGRLARLSQADRRAAAGLPAAARGGLPVLVREDGSGAILAWRGADVRALGGRRLGLALGETTQESDLFQAMHGETPPTDLFS
ncbi:hypothetical protein D3C86_1396760 [compost metagenome]